MVEYKECENCGEIIEIKIATKGSRKGKPIKIHENKKFCSIVCLNEWQKKVSWEDRIGEERAKEIRKERSDQVSGDKNPSKDPNVAKKISKSMKEYLKENPRMGENNPFFGKKHSEETIEKIRQRNLGKKPVNTLKVIVNDILYESFTEASKALNFTVATIRNRCNSDKFPNYVIYQEV